MERIRKTLGKIRQYGTLVMFGHTIFSFSFAAIALLLASGGKPAPRVLFFAAAALLGARTGANALNRVVDARIDARNPRTAKRQIPKGEVKTSEALLLTAACFLVLLFSAYQLNPLCFLLSPAALVLMTVYSYTKRFTWLCHLFLGVTCAIAPVGAWLAVTGRFSFSPLLLGAVNCLWTAGFDVIYAAQDYEFDRAYGLHSIPVRFGVAGGLGISSLFHGTALVLLGIFIYQNMPPMGVLMWTGLGLTAVLMAIQHTMVSADNLKNVTAASYSVSQLTSLVILVCGVLDIYL